MKSQIGQTRTFSTLPKGELGGALHIAQSITSVIAGILFLGTAVTQASTINLSTGLDSANNLITVGNTLDAHWTVDQPLGGIAPAKVVAPGNAGAAFPIWAANGPSSSWITIDPNSRGNGSVIPYTYYRTFTLSSPSDVASASISGVWGIDDGGVLKLNGNLISSSPADYSATTAFNVAAGGSFFVLGPNQLTITMTTSDNFLEAVRLGGSLTTAVPDSGSTLACLSAALLGLVAFDRARVRRVS